MRLSDYLVRILHFYTSWACVTSISLSCRCGVSATMTVVQEWRLYLMISHCSFTTVLCNLHGAHEQLLFCLLFYLNYVYLSVCTRCVLSRVYIDQFEFQCVKGRGETAKDS